MVQQASIAYSSFRCNL